MAHILIIDDETGFQHLTSKILTRNGHVTSTSSDPGDALAMMKRHEPDLILLDIMMPVKDGFTVCREIQKHGNARETPIIFVTGSEDAPTLNQCFAEGGADYISKPLRANEMLARINRCLRRAGDQAKLKAMQTEHAMLKCRLLQVQLEQPEAFAEILTADVSMLAVFSYMETISASTRPILIQGETGVGKELICSAIHRLSGRTGNYVPVNSAGLDDKLFADTLFGHEKGAFTGALEPRSGLIEKAANGTLFLDEIGDLSVASQIKLLRLLQHGEYYPLGADSPRASTARIVAATNCNLGELLKMGDFRNDLYFRLNTHRILVPPLRERRDDIDLLAHHFAACAAKELGKEQVTIPTALLERLKHYHFPGNVRELEAMMFEAVSLTRSRTIAMPPFLDLDTDGGRQAQPPAATVTEQPIIERLQSLGLDLTSTLPTLAEATRIIVQRGMELADGNRSKAAAMIGISRQTLRKYMDH